MANLVQVELPQSYNWTRIGGEQTIEMETLLESEVPAFALYLERELEQMACAIPIDRPPLAVNLIFYHHGRWTIFWGSLFLG